MTCVKHEVDNCEYIDRCYELEQELEDMKAEVVARDFTIDMRNKEFERYKEDLIEANRQLEVEADIVNKLKQELEQYKKRAPTYHYLLNELERLRKKSNFFLETLEYISFQDANWGNYFKEELKQFEEGD